jgi:RNA polymerase sigma factor (sigma-70 family)
MTKEREQEIIQQVQQGNTAAFGELVNQYKDAAFTLCVRICGNHDDAGDICQDAFIKAFRALRNFRGDSGFSTWLYRIVYNTAISHIRNRKIKTLPIESIKDAGRLENEGELTWENEETEMKHKLIREIVAELQEVDRTIITLYYLMDHSVSEICVVTGISESSVKVRLHRARLKMHSEITKHLQLQIIQ